MDIATTLAQRTEPCGLREDFRTVGDPALLVTNEMTPAGFYERVRQEFAPDGYIFGPGCGNVISMIEAFAESPRGMVLVDIDPAVVWAGKMLVAALARHATAESFVAELFCQGPEPLERLAAEILEREPFAELRRQMANQRERLAAGLAILLPSAAPASPTTEAEELLATWASFHPPADRVVPVRTFIARHFDRLRELALAGRLAVVWASAFDPALLAMIIDLPGFREARNLTYLSNAADHVLRRALLADARGRLLGGGDPVAPHGSPEEYLRYLNEGALAALRPLAEGERGGVFVFSRTQGDLRLQAATDPPQYGPGDLEFGFDLGAAMVQFLDGIAAAAAMPAQEDAWRDARRRRAARVGLLAAAIRGDWQQAALALHGGADLEAPAADPRRIAADPRRIALSIADLAPALLRLRAGGAAGPVADLLDDAAARLGAAARDLAARRGELSAAAAGQAMTLLLYAQALGVAGLLLGDEALGAAAGGFLREGLALQSSEGALPYGGAAGVGPQAEALLRLALYALHRPEGSEGSEGPEERLDDAQARAASGLLRAVRSHGEIDLGEAPPVAPEDDGYLAYVTDAETLSETARLALLAHGLGLGEIAPIDAALRISFFATRRTAAAPQATHTLVGEALGATAGRAEITAAGSPRG